MIRKFRIRSKLAIGLLAAVVAALIGVPVYAHYIYQDGHTYTSTYHCTWSRAEISHGSGGGYSKASVKSEKNRGKLPCRERLERPIKYIKAQWILYKKSGSSWSHCRTGNWYYNGRKASSLTNSKNHGSTPLCGDGEYMTKSETYVRNGSVWYGGPMESGRQGHVLP